MDIMTLEKLNYNELKEIVKGYCVSGLGKALIDKLEPSTIVVYGAAPDKIFTPYKEKGIEVLQFDSDFMRSRKAVSA